MCSFLGFGADLELQHTEWMEFKNQRAHMAED